MKTSLKWYFLRWIRGPVEILHGVVLTLSFGFYDPPWILWVEDAFLTYTETINYFEQ